jgi:hypothetical protein
MKRFGNLSNVVTNGSGEHHLQIMSIDDDDDAMITHKLTTIQS